MYTIEIATTDFATACAATEGGADRIELCTALSEGGVTPSYGLIKKCRELKVALFPIIRPRAGDFLYMDEEFDLIKEDVLLSKELGCNGIVVGFLKRNGHIDFEKAKRIADLAYPMELTFHRAFDRCIDPFKALEEIIEAGFQRILTSGQQLKAMEGASLIKKLLVQADNRITIMPGSGVRPENIKQLADVTGAVEFHASLRSTAKSNMEFEHPSFRHLEEEYSHTSLDAAQVKALRKAVAL